MHGISMFNMQENKYSYNEVNTLKSWIKQFLFQEIIEIKREDVRQIGNDKQVEK